jgi:hypothetical protein
MPYLFRMLRAPAALAIIALLALAAPLPGAEAQESEVRPGDSVRLTLTTGETLFGELVERTGEGVVIRIAGVETRVAADRVTQLVRQRSPEERYRSMRAIIDDDDVPRLLLLVQWLMERDMLEIARAELDGALDREPTNPDARRLSRLLDQRITLERRTREARPGGRPAIEPEGESDEAGAPARERVVPPGRFTPDQFPLLTDEQVNLLKVYELDLDNPPRLLIDRKATERFLTLYAGSAGLPRTETERRAFFQKPPIEILELMFTLRARELYGDVRVLGLPDSLNQFRENVSAAWVTRNCGSVNCHGGTDAPPPHIYNRRPFAETSALTNFIILDRFRLPDGRPLIDYDRPADSPLLQLGLPQPDSAYPHPDVPGWRPAFRSRDSRRYQQAVDWINAMIRPRPTVPIEYSPPDIEAIRAKNAAARGEERPAGGAEESPEPEPRPSDQRR